jgi:hypothetical protein
MEQNFKISSFIPFNYKQTKKILFEQWNYKKITIHFDDIEEILDRCLYQGLEEGEDFFNFDHQITHSLIYNHHFVDDIFLEPVIFQVVKKLRRPRENSAIRYLF